MQKHRRHLLFWLLIAVFIWIIVSRFTQMEDLVKTLAQGNWPWLLAAALFQFAYYAAVAATFQSAFDTVGVRSQTRKLIPLTFAAIFVNVVAPTASTAGSALYIDDAARRGESPSRAAAGIILQLAVDFAVFSIVLVGGMGFLFLNHDLQTYEILGAVVLLILTIVVSSILSLGLWFPSHLERLLGWVQRVGNRVSEKLKRSPIFPGNWSNKQANDFTAAAQAVSESPRKLLRTAAITFATHVFDLASLYAVFAAFHQPVDFGPLVAGYAIGVLFWIISITPQGIGVVEGVMSLVYTSLGIPGSTATIVVIAFRGLTFWLPLLVGFVLLRRVGTFNMQAHTLSEGWIVRILAILVALMGVINVLSAVTPALPERLQFLAQISPLEVRQGGNLTAALAGFALMLLAHNLWRRKHLAWLATLGVLVFSIISLLVKGLDYEEASLAGGLAILLWTQRYHFHAASDRPAARQALRVLFGALLFTLVYGVAGFFLLDRHYSVNFGFLAALRQTVVMFTEFYDPGLEPITGFGQYFADSIYLVGAGTLGYALMLLLRPVVVHPSQDPDEHMRAKRIVETYGHTSLARVALFEDKSYFFSPGGSVVAFATRERTSLALGDPIGPVEDLPAAIEAFKDFCAKNDWSPVFYQVMPDHLDVYKAAGFETICIGHEGIVDLRAFTLEGKAAKDMRTAINRMTRDSFRFAIHQPPIPDGLLNELRAISDEWLTMMHGTEKRFSLGWFEDDYIRECLIASVEAPEGTVAAFANLVSEYQQNEVTIDLMRRRENVPHGTMDFLFALLFRWAKEAGYDSFNLGLSPLSGVGKHPEDPAFERALHFIYEHINRFYNFQGLHQFKEKFSPRWEPRYLVYSGAASLPGVWATLMRVHSSDLFIVEYMTELFKPAQSSTKPHHET